jgi:subtilisin-like proprotein convertase family protein
MRTPRLLSIALMLVVAAAAAFADSSRSVRLRSGTIEPGRDAGSVASFAEGDGPSRYVVRFRKAPGSFERGQLQGAEAKIETPLPGQAFLVSLPADKTTELTGIPGVDWATPILPQDKFSPEIVDVGAGKPTDETVIVMLQLFGDADPNAVAEELGAAGLEVTGSGRGPRFGRVVLRMTGAEVESHRQELAERNDVFWVGRRHRRTLQNDEVVWIDQSGLDGGMTTPIHDRGLHGEGQIGAVLDTGVDADSCFFRDGTLGLPPTNDGNGTVVDANQRKIIAVNFLDPNEDPLDPTHWDTHSHGSHVAGTMVGDDLANPINNDTGDGMAPGAKIVIQDAGYAPDNCGDLPGIGCPVTDLIPVFQQAYDQGARVHNNSWNDNENASVQNTYTDASEDVDEFVWNNPDFLILFGAGNNIVTYETVGSPGTAKNGMSVGSTYNGTLANQLSDYTSFGPTDDGRIKPDVVSPGHSVWSCDNDFDVTTNNCATRSSFGTSHASPGAAGAALLIRQYFVDGFYPTGSPTAPDGFNPTAALVKAMLINSGTPVELTAGFGPIEVPGVEQGWGRVLLEDAMYFTGGGRDLYVDEYSPGLAGASDPPATYLLDVQDGSEPLKISLVWSDFPSTPAASIHLVNDLDLRVDGPNGGFWGNSYRDGSSWDLGSPDRLNNVEQVLIAAPQPGTYSIQVSANAIPSGPQPFALVVTGGGISVSAGPRPSYWTHVVDDSGPNGNGDGILDPGETATIPITLRNSGDADATGAIGDLFSSVPDRLKIYRGSAGYADIAVNDQQTSPAPHYEVTLEPSANCGEWVGANMDVSGNGFDVVSALTFQIGEHEGDRSPTDTPIVIPKSSPEGIYSYVDVPSTFNLNDLNVTVDIDHDDISQIRVVLYSPDNTIVFLHDQTGGGVSGLHTTYDTLTQPAMGSMDDYVGLDPQGTWKLRVQDYVGGGGAGDGVLEGWTLHFTSDIPFDCNPVSCGQAVPPVVDDTLTVSRSGVSDVQVSWTSVGATDYNVWRSEDRQFTKGSHMGATGGATSLIDSGAQTLPGVHYYVVRSVNSCRWESD